VKGQAGRDLLGPKAAGILFFVKQSDLPYSNTVVIEVECFGVIDRVADLDPLPDIGAGNLIERTFEADGGIVIDHPFVANEKDFIELLSGEPADQHPAHRALIAVDRSFLDASMEFMVIILIQPEREGFIELLQSQTLLESREEAFSHRPKEAFHLSAGRAIIRFGVDQGDAGLGTASCQEIGREG
jgi:hypothetical protein